jgi:hypothetical protein
MCSKQRNIQTLTKESTATSSETKGRGEEVKVIGGEVEGRKEANKKCTSVEL